MNILHVTLAFPPAYSWGGPVRNVYRVAKEQVFRGHNITIYCTNLLNKRDKLSSRTVEKELDGMRVVYFNTLNLHSWPGTLGPFCLPDLPAWLRREISTFDLVHLHSYRNLMNLPVARIAYQAGKPLIIQPRGTLPVVVNTFFLKRVYDRLIGRQELKNISALVALQESERQQAMRHGVPESRIVIIPNGLDPSEYAIPEKGAFRRKWDIPADIPLVLFVGRINKKKGTDMLVKAFHLLKVQESRLAIVGPDDGQLDEVTQLVRLFNLEKRVIITGLLAGQDLMAAYNDADLFILPCRTDTFPTTIMEACLANTPMVITEGCEIASLVQNRIGEVVQFDAQDIAQGIQILLSDHERYEYYRSNCPSVMANSFSLSSTVDKIEQLYSDVISREQ